jgi:1-acyl-sn-glycerol-3-phosphate acyltransferase
MPDRCIVVSNHQSLLDIPILMHYFEPDRRLLFVAKKELGNGIPLISSVLRVGGHALIDGGWKATKLKTLLSGKAPVEYRVKVLSIVEARADKQGVVDALGVARADIERQLETWRSGDLSAAART